MHGLKTRTDYFRPHHCLHTHPYAGGGGGAASGGNRGSHGIGMWKEGRFADGCCEDSRDNPDLAYIILWSKVQD